MKTDEVRIDKFLWAVRIFKTRSKAADACKKGRISIDGIEVKPSRTVKPGDIIKVKRSPVVYTYKIIALLHNRVSAKLVAGYVENLTPQDELDKLEINKFGGFYYRDKGSGRPTKKERRIIDSINLDD